MYFVIQVRPKGEARYIQAAEKLIHSPSSSHPVEFFWLRRRLRIRRRGKWSISIAPIFPGYIFIRASEITPQLYWILKRIPYFLRFLRSNDDIFPLSKRDESLLQHLLSFGHVIDRSLASFDENNRIKIISGPLKGLEGLIVKVDRRKQRVKIRLDLYDDSFLIDFGFESIEKSENKPLTNIVNKKSSLT